MIKIDKKFKETFLTKSDNPIKFLYFFLNKILSIFSYKKSYSQGSMDLIFNKIFKNKKNGIYIDVVVSIRLRIIILIYYIKKDGPE